jgi:hypothetical protein
MSDKQDPPALAEPPLAVLQARGERPRRLDAIAIVRFRLDPETTSALRRVALDAGDDAVVRAIAIAALAERGETIAAERQPPHAVAAAQKKATEIVRAKALVSAFERGERAAPLVAATLLAPPPTGTAVEAVTPDAPVRARIAAAAATKRAAASSAAPHVTVLRCGRNELAVVADPARLNPTELLHRPARVAQLAVHQTVGRDTWTMPFEILTEPSGDGIRIAVLDERGRTRFGGTGHKAGPNSITFSLQAASEPGATPLVVEGRIDQGAVTITGGRSGGRGPAPRSPQRMPKRT